MPTITVSAGATMSKEKKKEFMMRLTELSVEFTGAPIGFHSVYINEYPFDCMSAGNKTVEEIVESMKK